MRLTKNFNFIKGSENISSEIGKVENRIIQNDWDPVPLAIRTITENILKDNYGFEGSMHDRIMSYKERFGDPTVLDALFHIKNTGNQFAHKLTSDIKRKIDRVDVLYLIKSLSIICQDAFSDHEDGFVFNEKAYFNDVVEENQNLVRNIKDKELEIKKTSMVRWFEDEKYIFKIPFYQRKYTWSDHNVKTLINDIFSRMEDRHQHYFGVIAISKKMNDSDQIELKIIDGQQRITTSLLILRVCYDYFLEKGIEKKHEKLTNIFESSNIQERYLNEAAEEKEFNELLSIIKGSANENFKTKYYKNYKLINEMISHYNESELIDFVNAFINKFEIADLKYDIEPKREMDIFENMNSKGSDLDEWDLIKNQIFNFVNEGVMGDMEKVRLMRRNFESGFSLNLAAPNEKLNNFFKELCHLELIKQGKKWKKYDRFVVYNNFKKLFKDKAFSTKDEYIEFLNYIQKYAVIYKSLLTKISSLDSELDYLQKRISNITSKETTFFLFMSLIESCFTWDTDSWIISKNKEFENAIILLDSLFIRLEVTEGFGHSFRDKLVKMVTNIVDNGNKDPVAAISKVIYEEKNGDEYLMPIDSIFKEKLTAPYTFHKKNSLATKILFQLELFLQDKLKTNSYNLDIAKPSLEHVMPKKNDEWLEFLSKDLEEEKDVEEEFQKRLNMLGNFLVLPQPINSKIKKSPFKNKKETISKFNVPIIKGDKDLKIIAIEDLEEWTFELIDERTEIFSKVIIEDVFPFKI